MHLPATGGTALGAWLRTVYPPGRTVELRAEELDRYTAAGLQHFRFYHARYLGRTLFDQLKRRDLACITMLRDPIERTISAIHQHQRATAAHPERFSAAYLAASQTWAQADSETYLQTPVTKLHLHNAQTRVLGNRRRYDSLFAGAQNAAADQLFSSYPALDYPWLVSDSQENLGGEYAQALTWLHEMEVVGLMERFAESLQMIGDLLGVPTLPGTSAQVSRPANPVARYRSYYTQQTIAALATLNDYDLELYAAAQELFEQQWARFQTRPRRRYSIAPRVRSRLKQVQRKLTRHARTGFGAAQRRRAADSFLGEISGLIHVGANTAQERKHYHACGLKVIWIEADPAVFLDLRNNIAQFTEQQAFQALVTDHDGQDYDFHIANNAGASSSILEFHLHRDIWPQVDAVDRVRLRSVTLNSLMRAADVDMTAYQGLVLDTQGSELLVLQGAEPLLRHFKYIKTEAADFEAYRGGCLLADIDAFMQEHGFYECQRHVQQSHPNTGYYYNVLYKNARYTP